MMTEPAFQIPRNSVAGTVLLLILGAELGALWGLLLAFIGATAGLAAGGPLALFLIGPLLFAVYGVGGMWILIGTPIWGLIGGALFANQMSGNLGWAAEEQGVTFLPESHPINQTTQRLAKELGLPPVPFVGWYDADDINAFAMGTDQQRSLIAFSKGAVDKLSREELDAVIGHELGHVVSNDMARMTYAHGIREALTFFLLFRGLKKIARWVFTPLSELELLRFSRSREFTADEIAARLTSPQAMISVLEKLKTASEEPVICSQATVMMSAPGDGAWLSTHPTLDSRIAALQALPAHAAGSVIHTGLGNPALSGIPG